jgi:HAD superfamily hydrolase (TIGR01509 family)
MRLVVFDLDGTLTRPFFDFKAIRREIQAALQGEFQFAIDEPLLERILRLPDPLKGRALEILHARENESVANSVLNDGALEMLEWLRSRGIATAILTRNRRDVTGAVLAKHGLRPDAVATRDDGPLKPDPRSVLQFTSRFVVPPAQALVVGDFRYDIEAGRGAGARTCLITNGSTPDFEIESDYVIERLVELRGILA